MGTNEIIMRALRTGKNNAAVLALVLKSWPDSTVGIETVNWFRNRLRESGEKIPTDKEAKG